MNTILESADPSYPILDLGGGPQFSYYSKMGLDSNKVISVNLPRGENHDVSADATKSLPFKDGVFSTVLCLNVLEHISKPVRVLDEIFRVTEPGGVVYAYVPFIHQVHSDPEDFTRFTSVGLNNLFSQYDGVDIIPHSYGPISAAAKLTWSLQTFNVFRYICWRVSNILDSLFYEFGLYSPSTPEKFPTGYFIKAAP